MYVYIISPIIIKHATAPRYFIYLLFFSLSCSRNSVETYNFVSSVYTTPSPFEWSFDPAKAKGTML